MGTVVGWGGVGRTKLAPLSMPDTMPPMNEAQLSRPKSGGTLMNRFVSGAESTIISGRKGGEGGAWLVCRYCSFVELWHTQSLHSSAQDRLFSRASAFLPNKARQACVVTNCKASNSLTSRLPGFSRYPVSSKKRNPMSVPAFSNLVHDSVVEYYVWSHHTLSLSLSYKHTTHFACKSVTFVTLRWLYCTSSEKM